MRKYFSAGQPVLWRKHNHSTWEYSLYNRCHHDKHLIISSNTYIHNDDILPCNVQTLYLLGTNQDYEEWTPTKGQVIAVRDNRDDAWVYRIFVKVDSRGYWCKPEKSRSCDLFAEPDDLIQWEYATSIENSLKD